MIKNIIAILFAYTSLFSAVISENIIFLQDDATSYINYSTTRTDYKEFNIRLKKGKDSLRKYLAPIIHSYPNDYRLNKQGVKYDLLTYFSNELSTLKVKKFKKGHLIKKGKIFKFKSWIKPKDSKKKHFGFAHNKNFYEFYYIWVLPKKYEFVKYSSNKLGKWKQKGNVLVYRGINVNDLTFEISYKISYKPYNLSDILSITGAKSVEEGKVAKGYKAQLNQKLKQDLTINLVCDGVAIDGVDMQCPKQITIPKGKMSIKFDINTIDDEFSETKETFSVRVDSIEPNEEINSLKITDKISSATTAIIDERFRYAPDNHTVYMQLSKNLTLKEGEVGSYSIDFSKNVVDDTIIKLDYYGSAIFDKDYSGVKELLIAKGEKSVSFNIEITKDSFNEAKEHFGFLIVDVQGSGFEDLRVKGNNTVITKILDR